MPTDATNLGRESVSIRALYELRRVELASGITLLDGRSGLISTLRGLSFLATLGIGGYALFASVSRLVGGIGIVVAVAFVALVFVHARLFEKRLELEQRLVWIDRAKRRLAGNVSGAPNGLAFAPKDHPYADDLDLYGEGSVFQRLSVLATPLGEAMFAAWLAAPAEVATIRERQEATRELAELSTFREDLAWLGQRASAGKGRVEEREKLSAWLLETRSAVTPRWAVSAASISVPATLLAALLWGAGMPGFKWVFMGGVLVQSVLRLVLREAIDGRLAALCSRETPLGKYPRVLERIERESFRSPRLVALAGVLGRTERRSASKELAALETIASYASLRHNGVVHLVAESILLWDVFCAVALDRWVGRAGARAPTWLEALGEVDALASLGTYAAENPSLAWPELVDGPIEFSAEGIAHPLLSSGERVENDVAIGTGVAAYLVTGSNMSGKSTLLRAIGVNVVLAFAGAPVTAKSLRVSPLVLRTSMRIRDSLDRGVSHFYAELERLAAIVDGVRRGERTLFLLDEILHGTNSRERIIGAKAVILDLVDRGARGLATSHDLGLASLEEESAQRIRNAHFEEHVRGTEMSFDYKLRPGPVTTANALRLMRSVGLPVPDVDDA